MRVLRITMVTESILRFGIHAQLAGSLAMADRERLRAADLVQAIIGCGLVETNFEEV